MRWAVDVYVRGYSAGFYRFRTKREARADAEERRRLFGVLGCAYFVRRRW